MRPGLHRSNSSLELEHSYGLETPQSPGVGGVAVGVSGVVASREFGSASSLDKVDCLTSILGGYRHSVEELDNGATGTRKQSGVKGRERCGSHSGVDTSKSSSADGGGGATDRSAVSNGFLRPGDDVLLATSPKPKSQKSKERKARSESGSIGGGSIFRKLRGVKSDPYSGSEPSVDSLSSGAAAEGNARLEERIRRKAFWHYDCQSVAVNLVDVVKRRSGSGSGETCQLKRTNTTTGASAASSGGLRGGNGGPALDGGVATGARSDEDQSDVGDGKTNELVHSCPFFRNEVLQPFPHICSFSLTLLFFSENLNLTF